MIDLVITDVDGVLTDNMVTYSSDRSSPRTWAFNQYDWEAVTMLKKYGVEHVMLSGSENTAFLKRAQHLGIEYYRSDNKLEWALDTYGERRMQQTAFIGNDIVDLPLLESVAIAGAPLDAYPNVRSMVKRFHFGYACQLRGGQGAFREFVDHILLML